MLIFNNSHHKMLSIKKLNIKQKTFQTNERFFNMAPQPGLEPGTHGLTVRCSTD